MPANLGCWGERGCPEGDPGVESLGQPKDIWKVDVEMENHIHVSTAAQVRTTHNSQKAEATQVSLDGWVDKWMSGWMDGWMDGWKDGWMDIRMGGGRDGQMDGWMGKWKMDGWINGWWIGGWVDE